MNQEILRQIFIFTASASVHPMSKPASLMASKAETIVHDVVDENECIDDDEDEDGEDYWHTSVGKFKITLDTLPQPLQYIHQLLVELPNIEKPDILYFMLQCLNTLALHGDALADAAKDHRGFFIWCQENLLIKKYVILF